jgi:hypothetical protein
LTAQIDLASEISSLLQEIAMGAPLRYCALHKQRHGSSFVTHYFYLLDNRFSLLGFASLLVREALPLPIFFGIH